MLFTLGEGKSGALGLGNRYMDCNVPTRLTVGAEQREEEEEEEQQQQQQQENGEYACIAAGWSHSACIRDGKPWVWGRTHDFKNVLRIQRKFRLSCWAMRVHNSVDCIVPTPVHFEDDVEHVACGCCTTTFVDSSGRLWGMGDNALGQLGLGSTSVRVWDPELVMGLDGERVVASALGYAHGLALSRSGSVYSWGKGERGQTGIGGSRSESSAMPLPFFNPQRTAVSVPFSDMKGGQRKRRGSSRSGKVSAEVDRAAAPRATAIFCGLNHSAAMTSSHELYVWGKFMSATAGEDEYVPRLLAQNVAFAGCGQFHVSYMTQDGELYVMGVAPSGFGLYRKDRVMAEALLVEKGFNVGAVQQLICGADGCTYILYKDGALSGHRWTGELDIAQELQGFKDIAFGFKHACLLG